MRNGKRTNTEKLRDIIESLPTGSRFTVRDISVMFGRQSPPIQTIASLLRGMDGIAREGERHNGEPTVYMKVGA